MNECIRKLSIPPDTLLAMKEYCVVTNLNLIFDYYFQIKMFQNVGKNVLLNCQTAHSFIINIVTYTITTNTWVGVQGLFEHFGGNGGC